MPRPGPNVTSDADTQPGSDSLFPTGFSGGGALVRSGSVGTGEIADGSVAAADLNLSSVATALAGRSEFTGTYARYEFARINSAVNLRCNSTVLAKWTAALAAMRAGTRDAKILCVGDSTTIGVFGQTTASVPDYGSWPAYLATYLDRNYQATVNGLGIPPSSTTNTDTRWTAGTGWSKTTTSNCLGFGDGSCGYTGTAPAGSLVYADPRIYADTFDVYYVANTSTLGSITATATGGSGSTIATGARPATDVEKVTVTAAAAGYGNTVTVTASGGPVFIVGVEPYYSGSSSARVIRVGNAGCSGATSTSVTAFAGGTASNTYNTMNAIKRYAPDLTFLSLQINDANAPLSVATHRANYQALITAAQVSGDVILVSGPQSSDATRQTWEPQYVTDEKAQFTTCGYADFAAVGGSYTRYNSQGYMTDGLHPNNAGYQHWGQFIASVLQRVV